MEKLEIELGLPSMKKEIELLNDEIYAKDQEIKNLKKDRRILKDLFDMGVIYENGDLINN